jgi:hypothetical protein
MSSFVSANGPSMTVRSLPENLTRLPLELGWRPSPASMTPAFTSSLVTSHVRQQLLARHLARFRVPACLYDHHITRIGDLLSFPLCTCRTRHSEIDTALTRRLPSPGGVEAVHEVENAIEAGGEGLKESVLRSVVVGRSSSVITTDHKRPTTND